MNLENIIDQIVNNKLLEMERFGVTSIKAGNNGPYYNEETNVRNMAHWCVTFSKYYERTGDEKYLNAVIALADAILDSEHYNGQGVYKCRDEKSSDEVNGVIGAAWIIEGLVHAYEVTKDVRFLDRAYEMFIVVPFNTELSIWNRINTKGKKLSVDATFNHQLWFAAAGAMINSYKNDEEISKRLDAFVAKLPKNITIRKDGRIGHFTMNDQNAKLVGHVGRLYRDLKNDLLEKLCKPSFAYKEAGYHAFNLYGFAILKEYYKKDIPFLNCKKFKKSLAYVCSKSYIDTLVNADRRLDQTRVKSKLDVGFNLFSFAYNSPAFELPRVYKAFGLCDNVKRDGSLHNLDKTFGLCDDVKQDGDLHNLNKSSGLCDNIKHDVGLHNLNTSSVSGVNNIDKKSLHNIASEIIDILSDKQIEYTYDEASQMFSQNTDDSETLTARIYEYVSAI